MLTNTGDNKLTSPPDSISLVTIVSLIIGMATTYLQPLFPGGIYGKKPLTMIVILLSPALVILLSLVVTFITIHRRNGEQIAFQINNLCLWVGFVSGWFTVFGGMWLDLLATMIAAGFFGCAAVGGLIVAIPKNKNNKETGGYKHITEETSPWVGLIKSSLLIGTVLTVIWATVFIVTGGWGPPADSEISGLLGNGLGIFTTVSGVAFTIKALLRLSRN